MDAEKLERIARKAQEAKWDGRLADAKALRVELERPQDQAGTRPVERATNLNMLAFVSAASGDPAEAIRAAEKCLEIYLQVPERKEETLATYQFMLAAVFAEAGRFAEAVCHGEESLAAFSRLYGSGDSFVQYRAKDIESMRRGEVRFYLDRGG